MTAIVGILCKEGIVIGTDSSATFSDGIVRTIEQPTEKLAVIHNSIILAGCGQIGFNQRFHEIIKTSWRNK